MLATSMTPAQAHEYLIPWAGKVHLAAVNGPSTITLSGEADAIAEIESDLQSQGHFARTLQVNYAFHSHQMDPVQADLLESLKDIKPRAADVPMISTVTGRPVQGEELSGEYWWRNVRQPVQFHEAMKAAMEREQSLFLEISAHPVLAGAIGECFVADGKQAQVITTLRREEPELPLLMRSLGMLHSLHCPVDWSVIAPQGKFVKFPAYPWHKQTYWSESEDSKVSRLPCVGHPILGAKLPGSRLVFQGFIDIRAQPFAVDHKIQGHVLMPGTGFVEMGLALGKEIYGEGNFVLSDVELLKAAFMPEKETLMTQTILDSRTGRYFIETQPLGQPNRPWTVHCVGVLRERPPVEPAFRPTLDEVKNRCVNALPSKVFYEFFRRCGFPFGPSFRGLTQIRLGVGEMLGVVDVPEECETEFDDYLFHPAVLDACLQGNFGCFMTYNRADGSLGEMEDRIHKAEIFMPSGYDEVRLHRPPTKRMWTYVKMHERFKDQSSSDVFIFNDDGELIAEFRGFKETLVGNVEGNAESASGLLYEYQWKLEAAPDVAQERFKLPKLDEVCQNFSSVRSAVPSAVSSVALLEREAELTAQLQPICSGLIAEAFIQLGLNEVATPRAGLGQLVKEIGIAEQHRDRATHLLEMLIEDGVISNVDGKWSAATNQSNPHNQLRELFWSWPESYRRFSLIAQCAHELPNVLRGEVEPLNSAAHGNLNEVADLIWASSPAASTGFKLAAQFVNQLFNDIRPGRPARVLELKGGSGRLAAEIINELPTDLVEYVFCDSTDQEFDHVSESIAKGNQSNSLQFQVIDLAAEDLVAEGESLPVSEVIIAHECLTGQSDLPSVLRKLRQQLAPGGILLIIESLSKDRSRDLTFGINQSQSAAPQSVEQWCELLSETGFDNARLLPTDPKVSGYLRPIIVAQRSMDEEDSPEAVDVTTSETSNDDQPDTAEQWLIFADQAGHAEEVAELILAQGITPVLVEVGETFAALGDNHYSINPSALDDYQTLLQSLGPNVPKQVLYFWSQNTPALESNQEELGELNTLATSQTYGSLAPVLFCQAWTQVHSAKPTGLWLISKNAQAVADDQSRLAIGQTPLWGTGRVVMFEFPHFKCKLVDLGTAAQTELSLLVAEVLSDSSEDEIALRGEARYVHRFVASTLSKYADRGEEPHQPYRLHLSDYGTLDGMRLRPAQLRDPLDLPTLVEIEVHAAALNFSDVIKALGLYPGLPEGFVPVGIECAGVVTKVGAEVKDFKPGDEVVCITPMAISSHTYTDERFVAHKPKHLSMSAAATLPIAFLTAHYALNYIGRMEKGEKVLVNAATGGVGLAAIQLAQAAGAELFATAGTDEKRALLDFLGVEHIMNSRTLAFADEVLEKTNQRGVDLILNSLSGEAIGKGMSILAPYGRFLEIGKRDIYANTPLGLRNFRNNVSFAAIDLDRGLREKTGFVLENVSANYRRCRIKKNRSAAASRLPNFSNGRCFSLHGKSQAHWQSHFGDQRPTSASSARSQYD